MNMMVLSRASLFFARILSWLRATEDGIYLYYTIFLPLLQFFSKKTKPPFGDFVFSLNRSLARAVFLSLAIDFFAVIWYDKGNNV